LAGAIHQEKVFVKIIPPTEISKMLLAVKQLAILATKSSYFQTVTRWRGNEFMDIQLPEYETIPQNQIRFLIREMAMPTTNIQNIMMNVHLCNLTVLADYFAFEELFISLQDHFTQTPPFMASPYYLESLTNIYDLIHPKVVSLCEGIHVQVPTIPINSIPSLQPSELIQYFLEYITNLQTEDRAKRNTCAQCNKFCIRYSKEDTLQGNGRVVVTPCCASLLHADCVALYLWFAKCPRCQTGYKRLEICTRNEQLHITLNRGLLRAENGICEARLLRSLADICRSMNPCALDWALRMEY
jgi:hypothetical protein